MSESKRRPGRPFKNLSEETLRLIAADLEELEATNPEVKEAADALTDLVVDPLKRPLCKCGARHMVCPKDREPAPEPPAPFVPVTLSCGTTCYVPRFHSSPGLEVVCPGAEAIKDSPISCQKKHVATIRGQVRRSA